MPSVRVLFDAAKVAKQHPTRTAKTDDALTKNDLVAYFRNCPFSARGVTNAQSATYDLFSTHLLGSSVDFVGS